MNNPETEPTAPANNGKRWSKVELELLMDPTLEDGELAEVLERTLISVRDRRKLLSHAGLYESPRSRHRYTDEEDEFIATHTVRESSEFIGVSMNSINYRKKKLVSEGKLVPGRWRYTPGEIEILGDTSLSDRECAELTGRSVRSVARKRDEMEETGSSKFPGHVRHRSDFHRYTEEEDEFIATHTIRESSEFVGVPEHSIGYRRKVLADRGRIEMKARRLFSDDEIQTLKDVSLSNAECARMMGRAYATICRKRSELKRSHQLGETRRDGGYTDDEMKVLSNPNISNYECARKLGRTTASIKSKRSQLELDEKVLRSPRRDGKGIYYHSEVEAGPYPTTDELRSWGIRVDRDWDELPFNLEEGEAW